jgi:tRNA-specific 2-thiouridylase
MKNAVKTTKKRVLVAMSGGVDSSVAALMLIEAGFDVMGATMSLGVHQQGPLPGRFTDEAIKDAKRVCAGLKIDHLVFECAPMMEEKVIAKFITEYMHGRTPNPCVDCNRHLKFGELVSRARELNFDYLATGHYARILQGPGGKPHLLRATDLLKDQSYFLYGISKDDLEYLLFPLGEMTKQQVRQKSLEAGLHTARRSESQDICFVPDGDYRKVFASRNINMPEGDIVDQSGRRMGRHRGIADFTVGQRGGLRISAPSPLYVLSLDARSNTVVVGGKEDLFAPGLVASDLNLLTDGWPAEAEAKIRYRKKPTRCRLSLHGDKLAVHFSEAQEAITPGQSVVFYDGDRVLGGGVIESAIGE